MWLALSSSPAVWGFLGAFIYAAPRLTACVVAAQAARGGSLVCLLEFFTASGVGAVAAAAFAPTLAHLVGADRDINAISAMIGLIANRTAPKLVETLSTITANIVSGRIMKTFKGDE